MMMHLMRRDLNPAILDAKPQNQVTGFLGGGLPSSAQLWSKAGRMSQVRHDAAYIECDRHLPYLLVVFTEAEAQSQNPQLLPFLSQRILEQVPLRH
jgi:beta-lactamase class A